MKILPILAGLILMLFACTNNPKIEEKTVTTETTTVPALKYTLTAFTPSHDFPDASLQSINYKGGKFTAQIADGAYKLGEQTPDAPLKQCANSAEGQHLHLIVDTEPYIAKYTSSFDQEIPDGEHYVLSFLSRSYHESLKTPAAGKALKVNVKNKNFDKTEPVQGPMLFYSRPKGLYTGDDKKKVMLDFYLVNTDLGEYKVEADINGEKHLIDTWQPYFIEGLPDGDNTIKLSLLDKGGQLANVPLNPVTRTFQLEKSPESN